MATITKMPELYGYIRDNNGSSDFFGWYSTTPGAMVRLQTTNYSSGYYYLQYALYKAKTPINPSTITGVTLELTFSPVSGHQNDGIFRCAIFNVDPRNNFSAIATQDITITNSGSAVTKKFSFTGLNFTANDIIGFAVQKREGASGNWDVYNPVTSITYTPPTLGMSVSPSTVYDIVTSITGYTNEVKLDFTNRANKKLNGTLLYTKTVV